ncbi:RNA-binding S4 domain-containing protein [Sphingomonas sp. M1-B02]|uniref:RNA-binding S4 domain-containing protein n=1 Tax=Sphingomonas sp. M1-B02 TaxID=3114300 RepID=UPI0022409E42|nr:S4 domain-containing protein [Sphingomonas sp. S6-11]UZK64994.1 S4 domain-containing protein [Sphingomonas sp. S6-11]
MAEGASIRLDRFLWFARIAKTRSAAQAIAEKGTLRLDGRRIERAAAPVRVGCILVFPLYGQVRALRVEALPSRRGPPAEAATLYTPLEIQRPNPVDGIESGA